MFNYFCSLCLFYSVTGSCSSKLQPARIPPPHSEKSHSGFNSDPSWVSPLARARQRHLRKLGENIEEKGNDSTGLLELPVPLPELWRSRAIANRLLVCDIAKIKSKELQGCSHNFISHFHLDSIVFSFIRPIHGE